MEPITLIRCVDDLTHRCALIIQRKRSCPVGLTSFVWFAAIWKCSLPNWVKIYPLFETTFSLMSGENSLRCCSILLIWGIRLAQWFLPRSFTSVDPGSNPTSYRSLAHGFGFQSLRDCVGFPNISILIS